MNRSILPNYTNSSTGEANIMHQHNGHTSLLSSYNHFFIYGFDPMPTLAGYTDNNVLEHCF